MFDFEKLSVYQKAKAYNSSVSELINQISLEKHIRSQLHRASFSIMLNIAEGSGRFTNRDKRNFYVISRGSAFECVAVFDFLKDNRTITLETYQEYYEKLEELSKMLLGMIKHLS